MSSIFLLVLKYHVKIPLIGFMASEKLSELFAGMLLM
jgi:hypothetical protein